MLSTVYSLYLFFFHALPSSFCQKIARELDDSVTSLAIIDGMLEDLEILPQSEHETCHRKSERTLSEQADILRL